MINQNWEKILQSQITKIQQQQKKPSQSTIAKCI